MDKYRRIDELQKEFDQLDNAVNGPDKYVLRGQKILVESNARVEQAIDNFNKSTNRTEKIMILISIANAFLALVQLILFFRH